MSDLLYQIKACCDAVEKPLGFALDRGDNAIDTLSVPLSTQEEDSDFCCVVSPELQVSILRSAVVDLEVWTCSFSSRIAPSEEEGYRSEGSQAEDGGFE